jgi:hypothetical protein
MSLSLYLLTLPEVIDRWSGSNQSEVAAFVTGEKQVCCTKEEARGGRMGLCPNDHRVARN